VLAVHDGGRRLEVRGEDGRLLEFTLNPASARFLGGPDAGGPRLELLDRD